MPALLLYLLKVNVALLLFYLAYHLVLRRLTFYHLNRRFLLFGILFSTVYPFIDITPFLEKHQELPVVYFATVPTWAPPAAAAAAPDFDFWQLPVWLFWLGTGVMALRLVLQFVSLYKIHAASVPDSHNGIGFRQVRSISQAFSFWQNIYLNRAQHKQEELESILRHEQVHVREWHTLDVLLAEISAVFYWFNPGAWLMKKGIKENLEFIADQDVVRTGADKKEYQYLLLKATGATEPQIALPFSFPSLKRRIAMMNKMPTKKANRLRLLVALPLVAVLLLAFRGASQSVDTLLNEPTETPQQQSKPDEYKEFYKRNPQVRKVFWTADNKIGIRLETTEEFYDPRDKAQMATAEKKYGMLPSSPPLAKVVTEDEVEAEYKAGVTDLENREQLLIPSDFGYYQDKNNLPVAYTNFLRKNPGIDKIGYKAREPLGIYAMVIFLKSGETEIYDSKDSKSMAAAEAKYGKLPERLPPPPPVVIASVVEPEDRAKEKLPKGYADFLKLNPTVRRVGSITNDEGQLTTIVILLKSGTREDYTVNDSKSMAAASAKYKGIPELLVQPPHEVVVKVLKPMSTGQEDETYIPSKSEEPADYKDFLNRNPQVKQAGWKGSKKNVLVIFLNSGAMEMYNLLDEKSRAVAEQKYGMLPMLPPPPPPAAPGKEALPPPPPAAPVAPPAPPAPPVQSENGNTSRYPGGEKAMFEFLARNVRYPRAAINNNIVGQVFVEFTVQKDGGIANPKILSSPHESLSAEALRVVAAMPKWQPAPPDDPMPDFTFRLPIKFNLQDGPGKAPASSEPSPPATAPSEASIIVIGYKPSGSAQAPSHSAKATESLKPVMYIVAEKDAPRFPGGNKALNDYISKNLRYPFNDFSENVQGKAEIKFTVDKDGKISNPQIIEAPHDFIARQLIILVNRMPSWLPAKANDPKPVFTYSFTIDYKLEEQKK